MHNFIYVPCPPPQNRKRNKTLELIVAEAGWDPPLQHGDPVHVRIGFAEEDLR